MCKAKEKESSHEYLHRYTPHSERLVPEPRIVWCCNRDRLAHAGWGRGSQRHGDRNDSWRHSARHHSHWHGRRDYVIDGQRAEAANLALCDEPSRLLPGVHDLKARRKSTYLFSSVAGAVAWHDRHDPDHAVVLSRVDSIRRHHVGGGFDDHVPDCGRLSNHGIPALDYRSGSDRRPCAQRRWIFHCPPARHRPHDEQPHNSVEHDVDSSSSDRGQRDCPDDWDRVLHSVKKKRLHLMDFAPRGPVCRGHEKCMGWLGSLGHSHQAPEHLSPEVRFSEGYGLQAVRKQLQATPALAAAPSTETKDGNIAFLKPNRN